MSWVLLIVLGALAFGAMILLGMPRRGWEAAGAALLFGLAGYALQARPGLPGAQQQAASKDLGDPAAIVEARKALAGGDAAPGSNWLIIGDAFARNGQYAEAAEVLLGAVEKKPNDAEAWLALANALVGHADGTLTPAALYAYRNATAAAPDHPGPPLFLGMALASSGRLVEARTVWAKLLAATPADAPWRADLAERLAALDAFIARQEATGAAR